MEDKSFELLTKMYSEFSEFRKEASQKFEEVKSDTQRISYQLAKLENDHGHKLDALLDIYKQLAEGQEEIKSQVAALYAIL
jgi:hypothetical protein